jgi:uncharacterized protein (TIGR02145 family)
MKMNNIFLINPIILIGIMLIFTICCEKGDNNDSTVIDADGNVYHTIKIGTQVWMVENLKTTKYNDGTSIPLVKDSATWSNLETPGYCWLKNDSQTYKNPYGALYNRHAVNTGMLCPEGWHVPTVEEWTTLAMYLGGESLAGGKLKEIGTEHWVEPNTGATNETGFAAVPAGQRNDEGSMGDVGYHTGFWSSTKASQHTNNIRELYYGETSLVSSWGENVGLSVRCIKD